MTKLFAFTIPTAIITAAASSVIYAGSGKKNRTQSQMVRVRTLFAAFALFICFAFAAQNSSAATLTVMNTNDSGGGSLRQAITDAAAGDTIVFDSTVFATAQTINLTSAGLTIAKSLTVTGPGARLLTVRRNSSTNFRVFTTNFSGAVIRISGMTISNGNSSFSGGGLGNGSGTNLTLDGVTVSGNAGSGGIYNTGVTLTILNSTISSNTSSSVGGVYSLGGTVNIANSTVSGNTASSTNNSAVGGVAITGSTAVLNMNNVTVTNNSSQTSSATNVGGVYSVTSTINVRNTIIAGNTSNGTSPDVLGAFVSNGNNLIGNTSGSSGFGATGDKLNVAANLAALANNGGQTDTHLPNTGSPAIDAGNNCVVNSSCGTNNPPVALTTDQRGAGFARQRGASVDIGAVETSQPTAATVSVGGRVMTSAGRGIVNVRLTLTDSNGEVRTTTTTSFGYYHFDNVEAGKTYILSAIGKRFSFSQQTQVLNINEDTDTINFIADSENRLRSF